MPSFLQDYDMTIAKDKSYYNEYRRKYGLRIGQTRLMVNKTPPMALTPPARQE